MTDAVSAKAIEAIEKLVMKAQSVQLIDVPNQPDHIVTARLPDGTVEDWDLAPEPIQAMLDFPSEVRDFLKDRWADPTFPYHIFINRGHVMAVKDIGTRRDRAVCNLDRTVPFATLEQEAKLLTQVEVIRLLRITFNGCLQSGSQILPMLRQLKFSATQAGGGSVQHGKESLGKSVLAELNSDGKDLPDEIWFTLNVYRNWLCPVTVRCAFEVLPHEQKFRITPFPGEIDAAYHDTLASIEAMFDEAKMATTSLGTVNH